MALGKVFCCCLVLLVASIAPFGVAAQQIASDMALGDPNAPVKVIEYASMTCPHCAAFHQESFPLLKEEFIDTGKVYFVFREFPLDGIALRAAVLARCSGAERFFPFLDVLFRQQQSWAQANDPLIALRQVGTMGGTPAGQFEECLQDDALVNGIIASRQIAEQQYAIVSTPTFLINGVVVEGNLPWAEFSDLLRRAAAGEDIAVTEALGEQPDASGGSNGTYIAIAIVLGMLAVVALFLFRRPRAGSS